MSTRAPRPGRTRLLLPALGLALALGAGLGYRAALGTSPDEPPANRPVSDKSWVSADEIRGRFPREQHEKYLRKAIANSRRAGVVDHTGGAFGAVVVDRAGKVVAEGSNHVVARHDPTWHGEMEAIRNACAALEVLKLDGCILYTSSEPCPMCLATAYWAGLDGIIYGAGVADSKQYGGFDDAFIYEQFSQPAAERTIPQVQMLRDEAVAVWREYAAQPGNVPY